MMDRFQSLDEIIAALRRRAFVILVVTIAGCILSLFYALQMTKTYEATAVLQIEDARVPDDLAGAGAETNQSARRVRLIEQRLMARDSLLAVMEQYDLFTEDPSLALPERLALMREAARIEEIVNPLGAATDTPSGLYITVQLEDPQKAADVANELMYSVITQSRDRAAARARDTLEFFATEETRVRDEIEALETELATFKRANADQLPEGLIELRRQLSTLRSSELEVDGQILALQTSAERQREEVQARNEALLREQRALLRARIDQIETMLAAAPEVERALSARERALAQLQEEFTVLARRKAEAELGRELEDREQTDRIEVLETALVPVNAVSRSRRSAALLGAMLSVAAGLGLAAAIELLNPAIRTTGHMERALGVSPVVAVPHISNDVDRRQANHVRLGWAAALGLLLALAAWMVTGGLADAIGRVFFGG
ncbi:Wzz/FepE/Etk N-terminal domain-containing protein [Citreimonas sp.]|uniref:Wzz/FepE/Etk N-terminal domain-containing protein n=1 Tax=Citreimonas sp. TaxID=3036715 RepID=UPI0035C7DD6B